MIVTCPNCGARYRIPDAAADARMKCAECQHRWVPGDVPAHPPETAPLPLAEAVGGGNDSAAPDLPAPGSASDESAYLPQAGGESDDEPPRPRTLTTIVAVIIGLALAVAAAGLWIDDATRAQLATVPGIGDLLARLDPAPSPLRIIQNGTVSVSDTGARFLDVTGTIANPTDAPQRVHTLAATLSGPAGVALRWTIPPPAAAIPAHGSALFASTVTGFPADATQLSIAAN